MGARCLYSYIIKVREGAHIPYLHTRLNAFSYVINPKSKFLWAGLNPGKSSKKEEGLFFPLPYKSCKNALKIPCSLILIANHSLNIRTYHYSLSHSLLWSERKNRQRKFCFPFPIYLKLRVSYDGFSELHGPLCIKTRFQYKWEGYFKSLYAIRNMVTKEEICCHFTKGYNRSP